MRHIDILAACRNDWLCGQFVAVRLTEANIKMRFVLMELVRAVGRRSAKPGIGGDSPGYVTATGGR
jgi:hypothetical protein